mmetsp:Transcript_3028/g.6630  ORF Transcript_3028/g.6630 Transcript_3028/m.6630 type:complete len:581 (-) Transcript_3028:247-1989(-)
MKLILTSTILIGAAAKPSPHKNEQSIAGLRGQQKADSNKQRELQELFGGDLFEDFFSGGDFEDLFSGGGDTGFLSGGDDLVGCGGTCTNPTICNSFTSRLDPTPVFKDACNAGCFSKMKLFTCEKYCVDDDDAASAAAAITAVERIGMIDSMVDIMCSDCKFYQCCVGNDAPNPTKYDTCMGYLADDTEDQVMGNSVLDQIADAFDSIAESFEDIVIPGLDNNGALAAAGDVSDGDLDSVLDQIADSVTEALGIVTEALDAVDLPEIDWNFTDNVWGDSAVSSGTDQMASGLSVLSQLVDSLDCPETCTKKDLCDSVFLGTPDSSFLEDACNASCLPVVSSCEEICRNVDGLEFLESVTAMACESCKFLKCCGGKDQDSVTKFDTCQEFFPEMGDFLPTIDMENFNVQEWIDSADWSGIQESLGLSELVDNLHSLLDEAVANYDAFPVTCNSDTCPIAGLCEMSIDLATFEAADICSNNALFSCGEGLEEMCKAECDGTSGDSTPLCSLCSIATCCKNPAASFEACAAAALPEDLTLEDLSESTANNPVEDSLSESSVSPLLRTPCPSQQALRLRVPCPS